MLDDADAKLLDWIEQDITKHGERWRVSRSGPHWSTLIRYVKLFDLVNKLQQRIAALEAVIAELECSPLPPAPGGEG